MTKLRVLLLSVVCLVVTSVFAKESVEDRLKPVGEVCMKGDQCAAAAPATTQLAAADTGAAAAGRSGEQVYNVGCQACHAAGVAGAPKTGSAEAWTARLEKGMDTLYKHAYEGFNAMPAKGLCANCTEDEIKAAVDYMLEQS